MPLTDTKGALWAHRDTVKAGDTLIMDGGFTCIPRHQTRIVKGEAGFASLYFECEEGYHFLSGQVGDDGELVGLYPGEKK